MSYAEQDQAVRAAIAELPEEFGLRAFPGERFRPLRMESYVNNHGQVLVYIGIVKDGQLRAFAKDTVAALRREIR
jgi:hypothetical protein